jgi:hypothetical protein
MDLKVEMPKELAQVGIDGFECDQLGVASLTYNKEKGKVSFGPIAQAGELTDEVSVADKEAWMVDCLEAELAVIRHHYLPFCQASTARINPTPTGC